GAHLMSMSTYKSLGGPSHGLLLSNDDRLSERIDAIAFPGITANFDAGDVAALGVTLADWISWGEDYTSPLRAFASWLACDLSDRGVEPFAYESDFTDSNQFALLAVPFGGGSAGARILDDAGFVSSDIGLPVPEVPGEQNGIRVGTPEIVRRGMSAADMPRLAELMSRALETGRDQAALAEIAAEVAAWRKEFTAVRFTA